MTIELLLIATLPLGITVFLAIAGLGTIRRWANDDTKDPK